MVLFAGKFMLMPSFAIFCSSFCSRRPGDKEPKTLGIGVLKNILDVFHLCGFVRILEDTT